MDGRQCVARKIFGRGNDIRLDVGGIFTKKRKNWIKISFGEKKEVETSIEKDAIIFPILFLS